MRIEFTVNGQAMTAGSKQTFPVVNKKTGQVVRSKEGRIITRAKHANPKTSEWMAHVAEVARQHYDGPLLEGPLLFRMVFHRPRPKSHYGSGRNADKLKASAPEYPITKPDVTKLVRAAEDALTGVIWRDDSQVADQYNAKRYGTHYYVDVAIWTKDEEGEP